MSAQPSLFDTIQDPRRGKRHRLAGDTERAGAEHVLLRSGTQRVRVLESLAESPKTDRELAEVLRLPLASICGRRNELREDSLVADSGARRLSDFGTENIVWEISDLGREALITIGGSDG